MRWFNKEEKSVRYEALGENTEDGSTLSSFEDQSKKRDIIWIILTCFFAITTFTLLGLRYAAGESYEGGFDTELGAAKSAIKIAKLRFTGELAVDDEGRWMRKVDGRQYVGPPGDDVDQAWKDLIAPINIDLEPSQAMDISDTFVWPETGMHYTGLTVHHSLHCLNMLRMGIYRDYYLFPEDAAKKEFTWIHLDHCIDFLRQSIQCQGDLTPMKWYWSSAINRTVLGAESSHTCRDWNSIQNWAFQHVHVLTEWEKKIAHPSPSRGSWSPN